MLDTIKKILDPLEDAVLSNPRQAIHGADHASARRIYSEALGWTIAPNTGAALRRATPQDTVDPDDDAPAGLVRDERVKQLRLELARSGLVALKVPAHIFYRTTLEAGGDAWRGIAEVIGWRDGSSVACDAPAFADAAGHNVTILFAAPEKIGAGVAPEVRFFELDISLAGHESIRPLRGKRTNALAVPHAGCLEKWISLAAPPAWPAELENLLLEKGALCEESIVTWLESNYRPATKKEPGVSRGEVYQAFLASNDLLPSEIREQDFGTCARNMKGFTSTRGSQGITWNLARRDAGAPLRSIPKVAAETISATELEEFRAWRASRELSPERRKARAEAAAAAETAKRERDDLALRFGSAQMRDALLREEVQTDGQGSFFSLLNRRERHRQTACLALGMPYQAIDLHAARASWWEKTGDPSTSHEARYAALVRLVGGAS